MDSKRKKPFESSEIASIVLSDGHEMHILDSKKKILDWVKEHNKGTNGEPIIDFSETIIKLNDGNDFFWIGDLCNKINGIINLGTEEDITRTERGDIIIRNRIQFEVKYKVDFSNSILYNTQFYNTQFDKDVIFDGASFYSTTNFSGSSFYGFVSFHGIDVSHMKYKSDEVNIIYGRIDFINIHFYNDVSFGVLKWENTSNVHFSNNIFDGEVEFQLCSLIDSSKNKIDFSNNRFSSDVIIVGINNNKEKYYKLSINFDGSHFDKKLKIWGMYIRKVSMKNCHFNDTVNISLNKYDANSTLDFSYSTINCLFFIDSDLGDDKGLPIELNSEISFYKSYIRENAYIFLRNINNGEDNKKNGRLNFEFANILGNITIQDSFLEKIMMEKATTYGNINIENVQSEYDYDAIVSIKNGLIKSKKTFEALNFKAKEMESYTKKVLEEILTPEYLYKINTSKWWIFNIISLILTPALLIISIIIPFKGKRITLIREYTLLTFNRISNNYGMSWTRGIIFTIACSFIFYLLYSISMNTVELTWNVRTWMLFSSEYWEKVLGFLWLPNSDGFRDLLTNPTEVSIRSYIWFILGKIFIAYGIFQTISAFRKYGKN